MCRPVNHVDLGRRGSGRHWSHPDLMGQPDPLFCLLVFKSDCVFVTLETVVGDLTGDDVLACICVTTDIWKTSYMSQNCIDAPQHR